MKSNRNHPFRKKWGQNFLTDNNLLDKIARTINPKSIDSFIEIGPGEGALTERIIPYVDQMAAIEIDPLLVNSLKENPLLRSLVLLHGDILLEEIKNIQIKNPVRVIGNIPYNITTPIIFWLIEQLDFWDDAFIMMQKEVAKRLAAKHNTKAYGRLTVVTSAYLDFEYCFTIKPDVFVPKPKVDSAIVRFTKKRKPLVEDEKYVKFNKLVSAAFSQRRKMLRNTLRGWSISEEVKNKIGFDRIPESLTVDVFVLML